ncbi:MAG: hypothetical protein SFX73_13730 [Kofleriaceae bacterium]|nr:hypothetical protein [Kofleriaceae bacterium]
MRAAWLLVLFAAACSAPADEGDEDDGEVSDGKADGGRGRFVEVDPSHSTVAFRRYINTALNKLGAQDSALAQLTLLSIEKGYVKIDELRDLTCADFERVRADLPDASLVPEDRARLRQRGSDVAAAIEGELDGYMWSNRIYVARGMPSMRLAATLLHEVNHVLNRSEVGYYDDLPTSAFLHEYRAFYAESLFDPAEYEGIDIVDYVIENYDLDRSKIPAEVLAHPLSPRLLPDADGWLERKSHADVEDVPDVCR